MAQQSPDPTERSTSNYWMLPVGALVGVLITVFVVLTLFSYPNGRAVTGHLDAPERYYVQYVTIAKDGQMYMLVSPSLNKKHTDLDIYRLRKIPANFKIQGEICVLPCRLEVYGVQKDGERTYHFYPIEH